MLAMMEYYNEEKNDDIIHCIKFKIFYMWRNKIWTKKSLHQNPKQDNNHPP